MRTIRELQTIAATRAKNEWNRANQDLLAIINPSDNDELWKKISAVFMLDAEKNADFIFYCQGIDQPNAYAAGVARDSLVEFMRKAADVAFVKLLGRHQIYLTSKPEGDVLTRLEDMEISAGVRQPRAVPPPPPVPPTAEELLRDEVILDFNGNLKADPPVAPLPAAKFHMKLNDNEAYRAMYQKLASEGRLTSNATTLTNVGKVGG